MHKYKVEIVLWWLERCAPNMKATIIVHMGHIKKQGHLWYNCNNNAL